MLDGIFSTLGDIVVGFGGLIAKVFEGLTSIFMNPATTADGVATPTFIGTLLLIGVGSSLLFWGFNFVKGLLSKKQK